MKLFNEIQDKDYDQIAFFHHPYLKLQSFYLFDKKIIKICNA